MNDDEQEADQERDAESVNHEVILKQHGRVSPVQQNEREESVGPAYVPSQTACGEDEGERDSAKQRDAEETGQAHVVTGEFTQRPFI